MSKREKRLELQAMKAALNADKSARLRARPTDADEIRVEKSPYEKKEVRSQKDPGSIMGQMVVWTVDGADLEGKWSWGADREWTAHDWAGEIEPNLYEFSNLKWSEVCAQTTGTKDRHFKHHSMQITDIVGEAQNRWAHLDLDQFPEAFRFRLGGKKRLWGYRIKATFHVVWWDPEHMIYPTEPKGS